MSLYYIKHRRGKHFYRFKLSSLLCLFKRVFTFADVKRTNERFQSSIKWRILFRNVFSERHLRDVTVKINQQSKYLKVWFVFSVCRRLYVTPCLFENLLFCFNFCNDNSLRLTLYCLEHEVNTHYDYTDEIEIRTNSRHKI